MKSNDDIELQHPSPVPQRKLKRLKKACRAPEYSSPNLPNGSPSLPLANSSKSDVLHSNGSNGLDSEDLNVATASSFETIGDENGTRAERDTPENIEEDVSSETRVSEFDSVAEDLGGNAQACSTKENGVEIEDLETNEL